MLTRHGALVYLALIAVLRLDGAEMLLLLAPLVIVPLALEHRLLPVGATAAAASFLLPAGPIAAAVAAVWTTVTFIIAARPTGPKLYLAVGGAWFAAARWGGPVLGFDPTIVLLTANHFHYAGFAALTLVDRQPKIPQPVRLTVLVAPALIAIGITAWPLLEWVSATLLAAALLVYALITLAQRPNLWLTVSSLSLLVSMPLAGWYAAGEYLPLPAPTIPEMVLSHGLLNAVGFALCGLIGTQKSD